MQWLFGAGYWGYYHARGPIVFEYPSETIGFQILVLLMGVG